jgi:hypothetical protein
MGNREKRRLMAKANVQTVFTARDKLSPTIKKIDKRLGGLSMSAAGLMSVLGGGYAVARLAEFTWEMGKLGAESIDTRASFESMMTSVGQSPALLDKMRQAAGNTVPDLRLMQNASFALAGTSGKLASAMAEAQPKMLEIARAAHKMNPALGSVEQLYQALNTGVKRNTPLLIDNLGIVVKQAEAQENYAKQLGKSAKDLTTAEKQLALLNETLRGGQTLIQQLGGDVSSAGDKLAELDTVISNLKVAFAERLAPSALSLANILLVGLGGAARDSTTVILELVDAQERLARASSRTGAELRDFSGLEAQIARLTLEYRDATARANQELATLLARMEAGEEVSVNWSGSLATLAEALNYVTTEAEELSETIGWLRSERGQLIDPANVFGIPIGTGEARAVWDSFLEELGDAQEKKSRDAADKWKKIWERAIGDVKSKLSKIMSPTTSFDPVAALDAMGFHKDTWDEAARQLEDIVNLGFGSPWVEASEWFTVPDEVKGQGAEALKAWAAEEFRLFYLGLRPEMINQQALIDRYTEMVAGEQAMEALKGELAAKLGVSIGGAIDGLTIPSPIPDIVTGWSADMEGQESRAGSIGDKFMQYMVDGALGSSALDSFIAAILEALMRLLAPPGGD